MMEKKDNHMQENDITNGHVVCDFCMPQERDDAIEGFSNYDIFCSEACKEIYALLGESRLLSMYKEKTTDTSDAEG